MLVFFFKQKTAYEMRISDWSSDVCSSDLGDHTIADEMEEVAVKGLRRIDVRDNNGDPDEAVLEIRYRKIRVLPPIGKQKHYPALISVFCILSWRVFWMTMLNRSAPQAPPTLALTATEIALLDRLVNAKPQARRKTLSHYLIKSASRGGYLARAHDPPPGNTVMWRGLSRLTDIALGAMVGAENVGN